MKKLVMTMIAAAAFAAHAQQADAPSAGTGPAPGTSGEAAPQESVSAIDAFCAEWFASADAAAEWKASHPVRASLIERYGTASLAQCSFAETANAVAEYAANPGPFDLGDDLGALKKDVLRSSLRIMKRALRRKGMSFVVAADGTNPIQTAVDGLSAALNAQKMDGVREWVSEWDPGTEWVAPAWMSDEATAELSESVFFGDTDFDRRAQFRLCAVLGVVRYNAFVDRYNGAGEPPDKGTADAPAGEGVSK